ncbi:MAG: hypothetical protein QF919_17270, partial [Nitrospinota bacterium]|nr:hypothetical protein [Nitrospinota bacterium]
TETVSSVLPRSLTSAGDAASRYAPSGVPEPSAKELHDKGLPADALEAEFTVLHEKGGAGTD